MTDRLYDDCELVEQRSWSYWFPLFVGGMLLLFCTQYFAYLLEMEEERPCP